MAHQPVPFLNGRNSSAGKPVRNKILLAIPDREFRSLRAHLESTELPDHSVLHDPHQTLDFVHFLNDGLVSLVVVLSNEKAVEAGIVGNEGMVGLPALAGLPRSPLQEIMQISGNGLRMSAAALRELLPSMPQLRHKLDLYGVLLGLQMAQTAACNRLHRVEQRLARWLLMAQDRVDSNVLPFTHDFLPPCSVPTAPASASLPTCSRETKALNTIAAPSEFSTATSFAGSFASAMPLFSNTAPRFDRVATNLRRTYTCTLKTQCLGCVSAGPEIHFELPRKNLMSIKTARIANRTAAKR